MFLQSSSLRFSILSKLVLGFCPLKLSPVFSTVPDIITAKEK